LSCEFDEPDCYRSDSLGDSDNEIDGSKMTNTEFFKELASVTVKYHISGEGTNEILNLLKKWLF
jgi:hypothetical protein